MPLNDGECLFFVYYPISTISVSVSWMRGELRPAPRDKASNRNTNRHKHGRAKTRNWRGATNMNTPIVCLHFIISPSAVPRVRNPARSASPPATNILRSLASAHRSPITMGFARKPPHCNALAEAPNSLPGVVVLQTCRLRGFSTELVKMILDYFFEAPASTLCRDIAGQREGLRSNAGAAVFPPGSMCGVMLG